MSEIGIEIGVPDRVHTVPKLDPKVVVTIRGDHSLVMEVLQHLEEFASPSGDIMEL